MLKDYLKKCAIVLNRDDILNAISSFNTVSEIDNNQIKNDVLRLISYFNFTVKTICEDYFDLTDTDSFVSDENGRVYFYNFAFAPIKILEVLDNNKKINFFSHPDYVDLKIPLSNFTITYKYLPDDKTDLSEEVGLPKILSDRIIIYGMVSEFLASKNQFSESEYWKNKFLYELFKFKVKKERRLKSTFCK